MGSVVDRLAELFRQARMAGWDDDAVARQVLDALGLNDSGYQVQPESDDAVARRESGSTSDAMEVRGALGL